MSQNFEIQPVRILRLHSYENMEFDVVEFIKGRSGRCGRLDDHRNQEDSGPRRPDFLDRPAQGRLGTGIAGGAEVGS